MSANVLIISGPSGCGKSTLTAEILSKISGVHFSISTTTRAIRDGEQDGVHYHFVSRAQFESDIAQGKFLEWAQVHNNLYGTSLKPVENALNLGQLVLFDVDVQGHRSIKAHFGDRAKSIFITTKNSQILKSRLEKRANNDLADLQYRLQKAHDEMLDLHLFDFVLVNDDLALAKEAILNIVKSLKFINNDPNFTNNLIKNW